MSAPFLFVEIGGALALLRHDFSGRNTVTIVTISGLSHSSGAGRRARRFKLGDLGVGEHPAAREKPHPFGRFHGKSGAAPRHHIDDKLGVPPIFELGGADIEFAARDVSQQHVLPGRP